MKRILTFSLLAVLATFIFASCSKHDYIDNNNPDIENGKVVYAPAGYNYYAVVQLFDSYAFIETMDNSSNKWPIRYDNLRGTFYDTQDNSVYNQTGQFWTTVRVHGFYNTETDADNALESYYAKNGYAKQQQLQTADSTSSSRTIK
ncbi:hypothetical protein [Niabella soli]|uniref:Lipoprotein n=1 Tax=Niabella soli DSM 19437 TaxID=929713 RepID=W0F2X7_9BACT|nr:hypothetical protein [Niabella soli]AHF17400.1 hypothetical protein NIASO_06820 [Niabella soli DSM 19437]